MDYKKIEKFKCNILKIFLDCKNNKIKKKMLVNIKKRRLKVCLYSLNVIQQLQLMIYKIYFFEGQLQNFTINLFFRQEVNESKSNRSLK